MSMVYFFIIAMGLYLFRKPIRRIIWHAVRYLLWHPKVFMLILVAFLCYNTYGIWTAPDAPEIVPPPPNPPEAPAIAKKTRNSSALPISYPAQLPPLPGPLKDGNSRFATDLMTKMGPNELQWYSRIFYHALHTLPAGETHQWQYQMAGKTMFGRITPGAIDKRDNGIVCRDFKELLVVEDYGQSLRGTACQRLAGGWCKLRLTSAKTCEITPPSGLDGMWYGAKRSIRGLF
jgi:hypothetical protein